MVNEIFFSLKRCIVLVAGMYKNHIFEFIVFIFFIFIYFALPMEVFSPLRDDARDFAPSDSTEVQLKASSTHLEKHIIFVGK